MVMDLPPPLWVPEKPAFIMPAPNIIRPLPRDVKVYFPDDLTRQQRRAVVAELQKIGVEVVFGSMLLNPYIYGAGAATIDYTYNSYGVATSDSSGNTYTLTGVPTGTAAADRYVVVCLSMERTDKGGADPLTGVTIGGITATQLVTPSGNGISIAGIWMAAVPTGTTATVVMTFSGDATDVARGLIAFSYSLYGTFNTTPYDTGGASSSATNTGIGTTVDAKQGGLIIAVYTIADDLAPSPGMTGVTMDDGYVTGGSNDYSGWVGSYQPIADETNRSVSATHGSFGDVKRLNVVSFQP